MEPQRRKKGDKIAKDTLLEAHDSTSVVAVDERGEHEGLRRS